LIAIYAGVKASALVEYPANMTMDEKEDHHKNLLTFTSEISLDVPPHMDSIVEYRASLGHKVKPDLNVA
jgi:hypothetical protein